MPTGNSVTSQHKSNENSHPEVLTHYSTIMKTNWEEIQRTPTNALTDLWHLGYSGVKNKRIYFVLLSACCIFAAEINLGI
jgi:hypothetical protein